MITFLATVHIIACVVLIGLVLIQDSKGGGMFSGQSSSSSVLGATGGASLAGNATKAISIVLAITCVGLAMLSSKTQKSVIDTGVMGSAAVPNPVPAQPTAAPANPSAATTQTAPANPDSAPTTPSTTK